MAPKSTQSLQGSALSPSASAPKTTHFNKSCGHSNGVSNCRACWLHYNNGESWGIFCKHGTQKSRCRICKGRGVCEHDRLHFQCLKCNTGSRICHHSTYRERCELCKAESIKPDAASSSGHTSSNVQQAIRSVSPQPREGKYSVHAMYDIMHSIHSIHIIHMDAMDAMDAMLTL